MAGGDSAAGSVVVWAGCEGVLRVEATVALKVGSRAASSAGAEEAAMEGSVAGAGLAVVMAVMQGYS